MQWCGVSRRRRETGELGRGKERASRGRPQESPIGKSERLDLPLSRETKARRERAAEIAGASSVAGFVKMVATERADALIREHDTLTLTGDEGVWVHAFLHEPPREPTAALGRAIERRRELLGRE